jgi:hypothetical protein
MVDFKLLGITDVGYRDGAADLEYTYLRGNIRMHGVNRMLRLDGEVYTIYFLATEVAWPTDREVMSAIQPSFTLAG